MGLVNTAAPTLTPAPTPAPIDPTISTWYRNTLGRDPDQAGGQFWTDAIAKEGKEAAFGDFSKSAMGQESGYFKPTTVADAEKAYTGPTSNYGNSNVDEWAQNVFGRSASQDEVNQYGGATNAQDADANFQKFVSAGTASGGQAKPMDMLAASRLAQPGLVKGGYNELQPQFRPDLNHEVDFSKMTIEGRIQNLMQTDDKGNYTNPTVRQAVERATQTFARRGLVNTSMAAQAGQEAAISKAIEIAGPDAQTYFQQGRANQDARNVFAGNEVQQQYTERNNANAWQHDANMQGQRIAADATTRHEDQSFNLRQNYVTAQDRVSQSYQTAVSNINTSNMTPEDKTAAINNAANIRDSESAYVNTIFSKQPEWQSSWLALSVSLGAADVASISDVNVLSTIAADPAQPQGTRDKASARLKELQTNPPTPAPTPAPGLVNSQPQY